MIALKNLLLSISFFISCYIGFGKSKQYSDRVLELTKYKNAINMFKSKIEFTYEPIKEIFESISKSVYDEKSNIFKNTIDNLKYEDIGLVWKKVIDSYEGSFNKEDKEIIKMFGKLLGKTDKKGQISEIMISENLIEMQIKKAEEEKIKSTKLYKSLGVIIGVGIIIIFI